MCRQVQDLRSVVRGELEKWEQDLKCKREELAQLEARKEVLEASGLSLAPRVPASVPGMSKGASPGPSTPKKKKKNKQKTSWPALTREAGVL